MSFYSTCIVTSGIELLVPIIQFISNNYQFIVRLTIVYAIVLAFCATLIVYIGTGPNWYNVISSSQGCQLNWWKHFLYGNFIY